MEENKMKKMDAYFEKERMYYVINAMKGDREEAALHLGRMQGYKQALFISGADCTNIFEMHDRVMDAIDFASRMRKRYRKMR